MDWYGIDLRWAYANLLPAICQQTKSIHLAQDILHDALLRYALLDNFKTILCPHAYLRKVVNSILVDNYRHTKQFVSLNADKSDKDRDEVVLNLSEIQYAPSSEHLVDLQQRLSALQIVINALPPKCREVFWLYRVDGLSQPEIAKQLGISLNMVEKHMMRAMIDLSEACERILN